MFESFNPIHRMLIINNDQHAAKKLFILATALLSLFSQFHKPLLYKLDPKNNRGKA